MNRQSAVSQKFLFAAAPVLLVFICELLFVLRVSLVFRSHIEAGLIPMGADLIVHGKALYKDVFTVMWPGSYVLLAIAYLLFGYTWSVTRIMLALTVFCTGLLSFGLLRRYCGVWISTLPSAILCFVALPAWSINYHHWDAVLFMVASMFCLGKLAGLEYESWLWLVLAGITGAFAFACYQPLLPCVLCADAAVVAACWLQTQNRGLCRRLALVLTCSAAFMVACVVASAWACGALKPFVVQTLLFPVQGYSRINSVPYAANNFLFASTSSSPQLVVTFLMALAAIPWLVIIASPFASMAICFWVFYCRAAINVLKQHPAAAFCIAAGLPSWVVALHRPEIQRLFWGSFLLVMVLCYAASHIPASRWRLNLAAIVVLAATAAGIAFNAVAYTVLLARPPFTIASRLGTIASLDKLDIVDAVQSVTKPCDIVLVYPYDTAINFLTKTRFPSIYPWLQYRYLSLAQMKGAIEDMERQKVQFAVWDSKYSNDTFASLGFPGYVPVPKDELVVEKYLDENYILVHSYGHYRLLRRK